MALKKRREVSGGAAESVAIQALAFLAEDPSRLSRFLAVTGLGPDQIRATANDPQFLAGVLEYLTGDEPLLLEFAQHIDTRPDEIVRACAALGRGAWERDLP
jgi:hypothetical protein